MDITVTIPNAKADGIIAALAAADPSFKAPTGTATEIRTALTTYYADRWKAEIRATLREKRRGDAIQAAVVADQALPDPLA